MELVKERTSIRASCCAGYEFAVKKHYTLKCVQLGCYAVL
jgi:hypothetical protein